MNDFATLFFLEIARNSPSASASDFAAGKFSSRSSRIFFGTVASIRASRLSKPTASSISVVSASFGPMWRREKSAEMSTLVFSRACIEKDYGARFTFQCGSGLSAAIPSVRSRVGTPRSLPHLLRLQRFDTVFFQTRSHFGEVFVITRFNRAENIDLRNIGTGERAIVNDLLNARAGGSNLFAQDCKTSGAIADDSAEPAQTAVGHEPVLNYPTENVRVDISAA